MILDEVLNKYPGILPPETLKIYSQKVIYHPLQFELFNDQRKFIVIAGGRRSGKTFTSKRKLVTRALSVPGLYFCCAPTFPQAKAIFWDDLKAYIPPIFRAKAPNESNCIMFLANGSQIRIIGLDKPQRFEGQAWTGGIIDEFDDLKEKTWGSHVRPALDTIGLNTWCIMCGVPEGKYLLYDLSKKAGIDENWSFYHWTSEEVLPKKVIESAKRDLSPLQYKQEYLASFDTATGIVYSDYNSAKNNTNMVIDKDLPIQWTHDFNYAPMSSCIIQEKNGFNHVVDEIILQSATASNVANEFVDRYKDHKNKRVYIFGDYSGVAGEKHNQSSDYKVMEKILLKHGWKLSRHVRANPLIKDGQNSLRAQICNNNNERNLLVNVKKCYYVDQGLSRTSLIKGSTYQEVEDEFQHITTALRYWSYTRYPIINGKRPRQRQGII